MTEEVKPIKTEKFDNPDGTQIIKGFYNQYINLNIEGVNYKSYKIEIMPYKNLRKEYYYSNQDYTELTATIYEYKHDNDNTEKQIIWKNTNEEWQSVIFEYNTKGKIVRFRAYSDKDMTNLVSEDIYEYESDEIYSCRKILHKNLEVNEYQIIEYYKEDRIAKKLYYKDINFNKLFATQAYEYLQNGKSITNVVFEELYKNIYSLKEYRNKEGKSTYCLGFTDKCFKSLCGKKWIKYNKLYIIGLKTYTKKQDGYFSEIEKYDMNKNLIYKKHYKFKGILAHILFWLAR